MGILDSINRRITKYKVINTILNSEQQNNSVVNVFRMDQNNAGDFFCAPHHYFKELQSKTLDIFDYKHVEKTDNYINKITHNSLIIGGGGLLNRSSFEKQMKLFENISQKGKKTVLWGVGHNEKDRKSFGKVSNYNIDTSKFGIVGVRDYNMKEEWIPCASCLHPIMDTKNKVENEVGIIYHKKTLENKTILKKLNTFPSTSNTTHIEDIIDFISKTDTIITDSYHAMYWSILLEKKIIALPNSSKFYDFKYKPSFSDFNNFQNEIKKAPRYSGVLEECREINLKFSEKVFDYLNL